jgi:single-strand DNA-binding protein
LITSTIRAAPTRLAWCPNLRRDTMPHPREEDAVSAFSADLNSSTFTATLTRAPELRRLPDETPLARLRVVITGRRRPGSTERPKTIPVGVHVYGEQAPDCCTYLRTASRVGVDGRLDFGRWLGEDGGTRTELRVVAQFVKFLDSAGRVTREIEGEEPPDFVPATSANAADGDATAEDARVDDETAAVLADFRLD